MYVDRYGFMFKYANLQKKTNEIDTYCRLIQINEKKTLVSSMGFQTANKGTKEKEIEWGGKH